MAVRLDDMNVGRSMRVSRPTSPGSHLLWWERLRGAFAQFAAPSRQGSGEQGSAVHRPTAVLPSLYEPAFQQRSAYLDALERTARRVTDRASATHP